MRWFGSGSSRSTRLLKRVPGTLTGGAPLTVWARNKARTAASKNGWVLE